MANKYRGQVELEIEEDDESVTVYKLHYDANALVEIEDAMGNPINTILREKLELLDGLKFQRAALHYGLQRDPKGRKLTIKQCGDLLSTSREQRAKIARAVVRGVFLALGADLDKMEREASGEDEKGDKEKDPLAQAQPSSSAIGSS